MANSGSEKKAQESKTSVMSFIQNKEESTLPWFARFAHNTSKWAGKPATFLACVGLVVAWAATGPLFNYSDTWQLVINTSTTIITFLMVFLIQNTQNRDALAFQIKLSELVIAMKGAPNSIASVEELSDEDLEKLQQECHKHATDSAARAKHVARALAKRRGGKKKKKS
ncbi:MAG TPA: low affinity iron permease family protein [Xanthobacteraceae bacterium]|nr:low affinity iron permease family protein [Xanthobacteraceae bacterium]